MRKVIRIDEPKKESKKPIELVHTLTKNGWYKIEHTKSIEFSAIKKVILLPKIYNSEDLDTFLIYWNDGVNMIYKGHLNDGVY